MARPSAKTAKIRFEKRRDARVRTKCEHREVRKSLAAIQQEAMRRFQSGEPVAEPVPKGPSRGPLSRISLDLAICRSHGVSAWIEDRGSQPPVVVLGLTLRTEGEGLAARLKYPQHFLRPAEYDLWEIRRDAPLYQILEDVAYQWQELKSDRDRRREVQAGRASLRSLFDPDELGSERPRPRGRSVERWLWSIEAYRRRQQDETWPEIAAALGKGESTVRRAVDDLCRQTGLPKPGKGTVLPDAPMIDCNNCPKRRSPSEACDECPWPAYADQYVGPPELSEVQREPPRDAR